MHVGIIQVALSKGHAFDVIILAQVPTQLFPCPLREELSAKANFFGIRVVVLQALDFESIELSTGFI